MLIMPPHVLVRWFAVFLGVLFVLALCTLARAEDWHTQARACAEQVSVQLGGCGSCSGAWREIARCTVPKAVPGVQSWITDACIWAVDSRPGTYDKVTAVMECATRLPVR